MADASTVTQLVERGLLQSLPKDKPFAIRREATGATPCEDTNMHGHRKSQGSNYIEPDEHADLIVAENDTTRASRRDNLRQSTTRRPDTARAKSVDAMPDKNAGTKDYNGGCDKDYNKAAQAADPIGVWSCERYGTSCKK